MIIDSIVLQNFRQYKGTVTFNFSTDKEKNVTVVIGQNTCGKTTLVQSFIWCLYGTIEFDDKTVLNAEVADDLKNSIGGNTQTVSVTVRLVHDERNYIVQRNEQFERMGYREIRRSSRSFKVYEVDFTGNACPVSTEDAEDIIAKILPENLSKYFFFWGERIENLSQKSNLSVAVQQFLGLDVIAKAKEHLKKALRKMTSNVSVENASEISRKIENNKVKIQKLEEENSSYQKELEDAERNKQYYKGKADEYYKILTTTENKELQALHKEYTENQKLLEKRKAEFEKEKRKLYDALNDPNNYVYYYANFAEDNAVKLLKKNPEPVIGWNYIDLNAIEEIIKRKKCLCGKEFCEGDEIYNNLIKQKEIVAPNVIGGAVNSFIEEIRRRNVFNNNYIELVKSSYKKINDLKDEIDELDHDVNESRYRLSKFSELDNVTEKYESISSKVEEYVRTIASLSTRIEKNEDDINQINQTIKRLVKRDDSYKKQAIAIDYCEKISTVFENEYKINEKSLKEKLNYYVSEGFQEVYSGDRIIEIDDQYKVKAKNKVGNSWVQSETSPGLETVKNFAFIIGLVRCAKEKIIGSDGTKEIANKNLYPLVLDAPFSQADEKHVPAISKLIAKEADQIILVIMEKDWNYAKEALKDKVGKSYVLKKITETHTKIEEVNI